MNFCLAPHPTELQSCTKRLGHRGRYHVCDVTDFGSFGERPKMVYLRWKKTAAVDMDSPARRAARALIQPGTPESRERVARAIIQSVIDDLDRADAARASSEEVLEQVKL